MSDEKIKDLSPPRKRSVYDNFAGVLNFSPDEDDFISIKNSIAILNLGKPESPVIPNKFGDNDKVYIGENSILKVNDFKYNLEDTNAAKIFVSQDKITFDLDWDKPFEFSYICLGKDLYILATDTGNDPNRNVRAVARIENIFGTKTIYNTNTCNYEEEIDYDLGTTNVYYLSKDGQQEIKVPLDSSRRVNAHNTELNLPSFEKLTAGLRTIFKDAEKEAATPEIETGENSVLNIFKDGFKINEAVAGHSLPTFTPPSQNQNVKTKKSGGRA